MRGNLEIYRAPELLVHGMVHAMCPELSSPVFGCRDILGLLLVVPSIRLGTGAAPGTFCRAGAAGAPRRAGARAESGFWRKVVRTWRQ